MQDLEQIRDALVGIRSQANAALERIERVMEELQAAEVAEQEPDEPERPRVFGGR